MKNKYILISVFICCFAIAGLVTATNIDNFKVAKIDIAKVLTNSPDVAKLKEENRKQAESINNFIETAKANLESEVDIKKRKIKEDNFNVKLKNKKLAVKRDYKRKILLLDLKIQSQIAKIANKQNYNLVLSKSAVLYGADDITNEFIPKK